MNNHITISRLLVGLLLTLGCQRQESNSSLEQAQPPSTQSVSLSQHQLTMAGVKVGAPEKRVMAAGINCTGSIEVPPQNLVSICAPIGGFIRSVNFIQGQAIQKGEVVAVLEHQEIIQLQQDYLETKGKIGYVSAEYHRKKQLEDEDATARREYEAAKADYEVANARFQGLMAQLALVGIDHRSLDTAGIKRQLVIRSPVAGYVTSVQVNLGQYVDPTSEIIRIVDKKHIHVELSVFVQDLPLIEVGQPFTFRIPGYAKSFEGSVFLKSYQVEGPGKILKIHGHITEAQKQELVPGTFVQAEIQTDRDTVFVVPQTALIREGESTFVFVQHDSTFRRHEALLGREDGTWVELKAIKDATFQSKLALEGAYYLQGSL